VSRTLARVFAPFALPPHLQNCIFSLPHISSKNRDNRRIGLKALVILPPIFLWNPIRFGLWNDLRICTAFQYSSLANHARISTVENRKLRMTIASRQSTNFLPQRLSCTQSLALAERSTSPALQDYL
jgi:hypothetical protein